MNPLGRPTHRRVGPERRRRSRQSRQSRQTRAHRSRGAAALAAAFGVVATVAASTVLTAGPAAARAGSLSVQVVDVSPRAPARSATAQPLLVTLQLTNTTTDDLPGVTITGRRGDPLVTQSALEHLRADTTPEPTGIDIATHDPVRLDVPADGRPHQVVFRTTYGVPSDSGVCECADRGVYPLYFTASDESSNGTTQQLDTAVTVLPSFLEAPDPVRVGWVWPLIDTPHRLDSSTVFTDDSLTTLVSPGGRLDRSLNTVERVAGRVPVTLVADPELLDELVVMATRAYSVAAGASTPTVPGTGGAAAQAWLSRFTALLSAHPDIRVAMTPYADPEITSLSLLKLHWRNQMPAAMTAEVSSVLAGRPLDYSLSWPASGAYTTKALNSLAGYGVNTTLLPTTAVGPRDGADDAVAAGVTTVRAAGHTVSVGLLSPTLQDDVAHSLTASSDGTARLSDLLGEVAIRAAAHPAATQSVILTPPRYVDPDPASAARTILESSTSPFARPISLAGAVSSGRLPAIRSKLAGFPSSARTLPAAITSPLADVTAKLATVASMLADSGPKAEALVAALPPAVQRSESSAWTYRPAAGEVRAGQLAHKVAGLVNAVRIVRPSSGTYTLASNNSPLPVTVDNRLDYPVRVRVVVRTENGLPGFRLVGDLQPQRIAANGTRTLQLPTSIERSGRIQIEAQLRAPNQQFVGNSVPLSVHSTALGTVGIVITVVAGAVLALALLVRLGRRLARRRPPSKRPKNSTTPDAPLDSTTTTAEPAA